LRLQLVIILPKDFRFDFLLRGRTSDEAQWHDLERILVRLLKENLNSPSDAATRDELSQICWAIIRRMLAWKVLPPTHEHQEDTLAPFDEFMIYCVVKAAVKLDDIAMFLDAYPLCSGEVHSSMFYAVGRALVRWNLHSVLEKFVLQDPQIAYSLETDLTLQVVPSDCSFRLLVQSILHLQED